MTASTTADPGTATGRLLADSATSQTGAIGGATPHTTSRASDALRHAMLVGVLLLFAVGGFVTARLASAPLDKPTARVCSETCGLISTTTGVVHMRRHKLFAFLHANYRGASREVER